MTATNSETPINHATQKANNHVRADIVHTLATSITLASLHKPAKTDQSIILTRKKVFQKNKSVTYISNGELKNVQ